MDWQSWCVAAIVAIAVWFALRWLFGRSQRRGGGCGSCTADCPLRDTGGGSRCSTKTDKNRK